MLRSLLVLVLGVAFSSPEPARLVLSQRELIDSLHRGVAFLARAQTPAGDLAYEYDLSRHRIVPGNNLVRQAGAAWVLALAYAREPAALVDIVERDLSYFDRSHGTTADGARFVRGLGDKSEGLGAVALVALAEIAYLSRAEVEGRADVADHRARLNGYIAFLLASRRPDGLLFGKYSTDDGSHFGDPSPYGDGEALLAIATMARRRGRVELRAQLGELAAATRAAHVERRADLKSFYQWGTMAFAELYATGWGEFRSFGTTIVEMASWELDVHDVLHHHHNEAYALEGLIPAVAMARQLGDNAHARQFESAARTLLRELMSWQVVDGLDPHAIGGVRNAKDDPVLRVDVTQHQMHAVMMALDLPL